MRNTFYILAFLLLGACDRETPSPPPPLYTTGNIEIGFYVEEAETGADLLDRRNPGHWVSEHIRVIVDGRNYYIANGEDGAPNDWEHEPGATLPGVTNPLGSSSLSGNFTITNQAARG